MRSVDRAVSHDSRGVCVKGGERERRKGEKGCRRKEREREGGEGRGERETRTFLSYIKMD